MLIGQSTLIINPLKISTSDVHSRPTLCTFLKVVGRYPFAKAHSKLPRIVKTTVTKGVLTSYEHVARLSTVIVFDELKVCPLHHGLVILVCS